MRISITIQDLTPTQATDVVKYLADRQQYNESIALITEQKKTLHEVRAVVQDVIQPLQFADVEAPAKKRRYSAHVTRKGWTSAEDEIILRLTGICPVKIIQQQLVRAGYAERSKAAIQHRHGRLKNGTAVVRGEKPLAPKQRQANNSIANA